MFSRCLLLLLAWTVWLGPSAQAQEKRWLEPAARVLSTEYRQLAERDRKLRDELTALPQPPVSQQSERIGWHSQFARSANATKWLQVDLGRETSFDAVVLVPVDVAYGSHAGPGFGFPLRFRVEASDDAAFSEPRLLAAFDDADFPNPGNAPGIEVCELFPQHAKIADKFNIIRSVCHEFADHGGGHKRFLTGRMPATPTGFVNDAPAVTSIISKKLSRADQPMPACVAGVDNGRSGVDVFSLGAAWLGPSTTPFMVVGDPSAPDFKVQNIGLTPDMQTRLDDRVHLLEGMDRLRRDADSNGLMGAMDEFSQRAFHMLTSPQVQTAFDLSREPDQVRDRYGRHAYGQRGLMARRLVEAGCRFVTMVWENPYPGSKIPNACTYNWDSHAVNCDMFADCHWRMPAYDQALTALIEDLYARGLDKDVLLVATGEFGRTPKINTQTGTQTKVSQPGRDHWPNAMSMLVSGGGMRTGQIIGATNARGEYPVDRQLSPNDLWATVYRHLGIDYNESTLDLQGRPMPILPFGAPIEELLPVS